MNKHIIHQSDLGVIALETKLQEDYDKSLKEQEFCQEYQPNTTFLDGKYDGELDIEPQPYQWFNPNYRKGYLAGVTARFNELFS